MLRTYVGGPNDGLHEIAHEAPEQVVVVDNVGEPVTYQKRTTSQYTQAALSRVMYAPTEMSDQEFAEVMRGVKPPSSDDGRAP
jgi:hypothetical protein